MDASKRNKQAAFWNSMMNKYEQRNSQLEEQQRRLQNRLQAIECAMPVALMCSMNKNGNPTDITNFMSQVGNGSIRQTKQSASIASECKCNPCTAKTNYKPPSPQPSSISCPCDSINNASLANDPQFKPNTAKGNDKPPSPQPSSISCPCDSINNASLANDPQFKSSTANVNDKPPSSQTSSVICHCGSINNASLANYPQFKPSAAKANDKPPSSQTSSVICHCGSINNASLANYPQFKPSAAKANDKPPSSQTSSIICHCGSINNASLANYPQYKPSAAKANDKPPSPQPSSVSCRCDSIDNEQARQSSSDKSSNFSSGTCSCSSSMRSQQSVGSGVSCTCNPCPETPPSLGSLCTCNPCPVNQSMPPNIENKGSTFSLQSTDIQYMTKLQELVNREKQMKRQLQEMQQREQCYMDTLRQADDMWSSMEGNYQRQLSNAQQQSGDSSQLKFEKMSEALTNENRRLSDEMKDLKLDLKQCMERVEGPICRQLEQEKRKCAQLQSDLMSTTQNVANKESSYMQQMSGLQTKLSCTCQNLSDLNGINEALKQEMCLLQCKYIELQKDLINQKIGEAHTLQRLEEGMRLQSAMQQPELQKKDVGLRGIARKLSKTLVTAANCNVCQKLPSGVLDTVKGIKNVVDTMNRRAKRKKRRKQDEDSSESDQEDRSGNDKDQESSGSGGGSGCSCTTGDKESMSSDQKDTKDKESAESADGSECACSSGDKESISSDQKDKKGETDKESVECVCSSGDKESISSDQKDKKGETDKESVECVCSSGDKESISATKSVSISIETESLIKSEKSVSAILPQGEDEIGSRESGRISKGDSDKGLSEGGDKIDEEELLKREASEIARGEGSGQIKRDGSAIVSSVESGRVGGDELDKIKKESGEIQHESTEIIQQDGSESDKIGKGESDKISKGESGKISSRSDSGKISGILKREESGRVKKDDSRGEGEKPIRSESGTSKEGGETDSKKRRSRVSISEPVSEATMASRDTRSTVATVSDADLEEEIEIITEVEAGGDVEVEVDTEVNLFETVSDGINIRTTITGSGALEVTTEGPAGIIETTVTYTELGDIEVTTEITDYPQIDEVPSRRSQLVDIEDNYSGSNIRDTVSSASRGLTITDVTEMKQSEMKTHSFAPEGDSSAAKIQTEEEVIQMERDADNRKLAPESVQSKEKSTMQDAIDQGREEKEAVDARTITGGEIEKKSNIVNEGLAENVTVKEEIKEPISGDEPVKEEIKEPISGDEPVVDIEKVEEFEAAIKVDIESDKAVVEEASPEIPGTPEEVEKASEEIPEAPEDESVVAKASENIPDAPEKESAIAKASEEKTEEHAEESVVAKAAEDIAEAESAVEKATAEIPRAPDEKSKPELSTTTCQAKCAASKSSRAVVEETPAEILEAPEEELPSKVCQAKCATSKSSQAVVEGTPAEILEASEEELPSKVCQAKCATSKSSRAVVEEESKPELRTKVCQAKCAKTPETTAEEPADILVAPKEEPKPASSTELCQRCATRRSSRAMAEAASIKILKAPKDKFKSELCPGKCSTSKSSPAMFAPAEEASSSILKAPKNESELPIQPCTCATSRSSQGVVKEKPSEMPVASCTPAVCPAQSASCQVGSGSENTKRERSEAGTDDYNLNIQLDFENIDKEESMEVEAQINIKDKIKSESYECLCNKATRSAILALDQSHKNVGTSLAVAVKQTRSTANKVAANEDDIYECLCNKATRSVILALDHKDDGTSLAVAVKQTRSTANKEAAIEDDILRHPTLLESIPKGSEGKMVPLSVSITLSVSNKAQQFEGKIKVCQEESTTGRSDKSAIEEAFTNIRKDESRPKSPNKVCQVKCSTSRSSKVVLVETPTKIPELCRECSIRRSSRAMVAEAPTTILKTPKDNSISELRSNVCRGICATSASSRAMVEKASKKNKSSGVSIESSKASEEESESEPESKVCPGKCATPQSSIGMITDSSMESAKASEEESEPEHKVCPEKCATSQSSRAMVKEISTETTKASEEELKPKAKVCPEKCDTDQSSRATVKEASTEMPTMPEEESKPALTSKACQAICATSKSSRAVVEETLAKTPETTAEELKPELPSNFANIREDESRPKLPNKVCQAKCATSKSSRAVVEGATAEQSKSEILKAHKIPSGVDTEETYEDADGGTTISPAAMTAKESDAEYAIAEVGDVEEASLYEEPGTIEASLSKSKKESEANTVREKDELGEEMSASRPGFSSPSTDKGAVRGKPSEEGKDTIRMSSKGDDKQESQEVSQEKGVGIDKMSPDQSSPSAKADYKSSAAYVTSGEADGDLPSSQSIPSKGSRIQGSPDTREVQGRMSRDVSDGKISVSGKTSKIPRLISRGSKDQAESNLDMNKSAASDDGTSGDIQQQRRSRSDEVEENAESKPDLRKQVSSARGEGIGDESDDQPASTMLQQGRRNSDEAEDYAESEPGLRERMSSASGEGKRAEYYNQPTSAMQQQGRGKSDAAEEGSQIPFQKRGGSPTKKSEQCKAMKETQQGRTTKLECLGGPDCNCAICTATHGPATLRKDTTKEKQKDTKKQICGDMRPGGCAKTPNCSCPICTAKTAKPSEAQRKDTTKLECLGGPGCNCAICTATPGPATLRKDTTKEKQKDTKKQICGDMRPGGCARSPNCSCPICNARSGKSGDAQRKDTKSTPRGCARSPNCSCPICNARSGKPSDAQHKDTKAQPWKCTTKTEKEQPDDCTFCSARKGTVKTKHPPVCECLDCLCDPCTKSPKTIVPSGPHPSDCACLDCLLVCKPQSHILSEEKLLVNLDDTTLELCLQDMEKETKQRKQEMHELKDALKQIQCACFEAELRAAEGNIAEKAFFAKQRSSYENTMSGLELALSSLQNKCQQKDRMIAAMVNELKLRANSKVFNDMLQRLASENDPEIPVDFDRKEICDSLPRPLCDPKYGKQSNQVNDPFKCQPYEQSNYSSKQRSSIPCNTSEVPCAQMKPNNRPISAPAQLTTNITAEKQCTHPNYPNCPCNKDQDPLGIAEQEGIVKPASAPNETRRFSSPTQEPTKTCNHPNYPNCPCNEAQEDILQKTSITPQGISEQETINELTKICTHPNYPNCPCNESQEDTVQKTSTTPKITAEQETTVSSPNEGERPSISSKQKPVKCTHPNFPNCPCNAPETVAPPPPPVPCPHADGTCPCKKPPIRQTLRPCIARHHSNKSKRKVCISSEESDQKTSSASERTSISSSSRPSSSSCRSSSRKSSRSGHRSSTSQNRTSSSEQRSSGSDVKRHSNDLKKCSRCRRKKSKTHKCAEKSSTDNNLKSDSSSRLKSFVEEEEEQITSKNGKGYHSFDVLPSGSPISRCARLCKLSAAPTIDPLTHSELTGVPSPVNAKYNSSVLEVTEIRRISPDSLLVKWNAPDNNLVTGYEILVDGIIKSRVHSARRTSAVLHMLTLCDCINISIFAITSAGRCQPPAIAVYQI